MKHYLLVEHQSKGVYSREVANSALHASCNYCYHFSSSG